MIAEAMPAADNNECSPLERTVMMWTLVKTKLVNLIDEIAMCQSALLSETTRSCMDCGAASHRVVACRGASTSCERAISLAHQLVHFNSTVVLCYAQLIKHKAIKPKCFMCLKGMSTYRGKARQVSSYLNFFCPSCSLSLVDPVFLHMAYARFVHVLKEIMRRQGAVQSLVAIEQHETLYKKMNELIQSIPTCADDFAFTSMSNLQM